MDKDALLKQITILDFMAVDLHLYLNTHPDDAEALHMYNEVIANGHQARCQYETQVGPLTAYRSGAGDRWTWENCPWPWQESFAYAHNGEERL